ncbi:hypothetical protein SM124_07345 [Bacillus sp. 31A1R]|uniref:Uncharacterized protein n=1 Tax=Robertmurraya mangrovi TaxID=3098077 RepID=A0ABU5IWN2_9BACI|nr:hypothetical protein [Bacillus sp. 31A1R]MDZ5471560.1 hypothetical protein [Bacillus sp. 31A1R]
MNRKQTIYFMSSLFLIVALATVYWFYFSAPKAFPSEQQLISKMNALFAEAEVSEILDELFLDESHAYVPFKTDKGAYGSSYWVWKNRKWQVSTIEGSGQPILWTPNERKPSKQFLVWNIDPNDEVDSIDFYLIKKRNYFVSDGIHTYEPQVQMKHAVILKEKNYGILQIPNDWVKFIDSSYHVQKQKTQTSIFGDFFQQPNHYIGWRPYDRNGKDAFPEGSVNGNGYVNFHQKFDHVMFVNENELE